MSHHATLIKQYKGFALLAVVTVLGVLLLLTGYFMEQSIGEIKISKSEIMANKTYYLAEAGANEAVYKLKNDATWKTNFLNGTLNNITSTRNNVFDANGSYTIAVTSISPGTADVVVAATYTVSGKQSKRVIKTRLSRATGSGLNWHQSVYSGGGGGNNGYLNVERNCKVTGGTLHANQNFKVKGATLDIYDGIVSSSDNIIENSGGQIVLHNSTRNDNTQEINMPSLDIDSASPTSLKNRANQVYTSTQFQNLPSGTILNGITFVAGNAVWTNKNLTINGMLASSGDINIDLDNNKTLTVNSSASGSGLFTKTTINLTIKPSSLATINGLIYASYSQNYSITNSNFTLTGGTISYRTTFSGSAGACSITYDETLTSQPFDPVLNGTESPIIQVNHWEESY
jgi:hypothetical protein